MIPQGIMVNAGLHIAKGHNQQANTAGFIRPSTDRPSQHSPRTNHCIPAAKQEVHRSVKKAKTTGDSPKRKVRHSSSLEGNSELLLALTWPKQLSCNPKPGYSSSHKHTMNDSSNPQSQNRETQPTNWKSIVAQNEFEHHNQQNVGETTAPKHKQ